MMPANMAAPRRRALVFFRDDSSLHVARLLADDLATCGWDTDFAWVDYAEQGRPLLSARQLEVGLRGAKVTYGFTPYDDFRSDLLKRYDAVFSAKFSAHFRRRVERRQWRFLRKRPCFVALSPGLEFTPESGLVARSVFDVVCTDTEANAAYLRGREKPGGEGRGPAVVRYNPLFVRRRGTGASGAIRKIVFFTQSASPCALESRRSVARLLRDVASAHPDKELVIKLRHLSTENRNHTHVEAWGYQDLLAAEGPLPKNMCFEHGSMESILDSADLAVTCTSTAGVEALAKGVRTVFFLSFDRSETDPLVDKMRVFLEGSGSIVDCDQIVALDLPTLTDDWLNATLLGGDAVRDMIAAIDAVDVESGIGPANWLRGAAADLMELARSVWRSLRRP